MIEMLRGGQKAREYLERKPYISMVTVSELICGAKDKQALEVVDKTCNFFPILHIDKKISGKAVELLEKYFLSHGLEILDALIAATALVNKLSLVTLNVKDFKFIGGLDLIKWNYD